MTQTVFDVGDLITSRLKLGVTPDGTSAATIAVYRPDGTAIAPPGTSAWVGDEKTSQWYATNDGQAGSPTTTADGDWVAVWTVTGTGASVSPKVYNVRALPASGLRERWAPFLSDVADHVLSMTVDVTTPGSEIPVGTFTGNTSPTDEQAHRLLDKAVAMVAARLGAVADEAEPLAAAVASLRAAAMIARTYHRDDAGLALAAALDRRADLELAALVEFNESVGGATGTSSTLLPRWSFPVAASWADTNL